VAALRRAAGTVRRVLRGEELEAVEGEADRVRQVANRRIATVGRRGRRRGRSVEVEAVGDADVGELEDLGLAGVEAASRVEPGLPYAGVCRDRSGAPVFIGLVGGVSTRRGGNQR